MRFKEIINENIVIGIDTKSNNISNTKYVGDLDVDYDVLVGHFGEPTDTATEPMADVNYEWRFSIKTKDENTTYAEGGHDLLDVSIYDRKVSGQPNEDPRSIKTWHVGSTDAYGIQLLHDRIQQPAA